ncbi:pilus assembly protein CpaC, partial [Rhizobium phaseoli]
MGNSTRRAKLLLIGSLSLAISVTGMAPATFGPLLAVDEARADSGNLIRIAQTGPDAHRRLKLGLNKAVVVDLPEDA